MKQGFEKASRTAGPFAAALLLIAAASGCRAAEAFADVHVHFNWDQKEIIDAAQIVAKMRRAGIEFAVVAATPSALALELEQAGGDMIIPLFSPYTHALGKRDWFLHQETVELARRGLAEGLYQGIGEVHFMSGFRPRIDNPVFLQLMQLAREFSVPVLIHVDSGNAAKFIELCRAHPDLRLQFAHAGGNLEAHHIRDVIGQCEQVMIEFSARDPWRYGGLTDGDGRLLDAWRELVLDFPDRFMVGTDPVWKVTRTQTWDQADDGWDYFEQLLAFHRNWIQDLPPAVQHKLRVDNARRFFERQAR